MPRLIANEVFPYAGRSLKAGEEFEALTDEDARILTGVGRARRKSDDDADSMPKTRRYNRRDMRAKD